MSFMGFVIKNYIYKTSEVLIKPYKAMFSFSDSHIILIKIHT